MKLKKLLLTIAVAASFSFKGFAEEEAKPNIIIFLVDDMGIMDTSVPFLIDEKGVPTQCHLAIFAILGSKNWSDSMVSFV